MSDGRLYLIASGDEIVRRRARIPKGAGQALQVDDFDDLIRRHAERERP